MKTNVIILNVFSGNNFYSTIAHVSDFETKQTTNVITYRHILYLKVLTNLYSYKSKIGELR